MGKCTTIILFVFLTLNCSAQNLYSRQNTYYFSKNALLDLAQDSNYEATAWSLSFIGDYKNALLIWDKGELKPPAYTSMDSLKHFHYFSQFKPLNAHDYIIERAKNEQVIIINEGHHQPYHRVFTESLLHDLYKQGYRYFGAETLGYEDYFLNLRKYPSMASGYYTIQPQYGNLIRTALKEGFYAFSYEDTSRIRSPKLREINQAKNIKAILDTNPHAKIIIHCGFDHLSEGQLSSTWEKAMAGRLKEYTGIDPFTIDQIKWTEHSDAEHENLFFKNINLNYNAVFIDSAGNMFNGSPHNDRCDIRVYHPRTKWINGRPNWVFENEKYSFFINNKIKVSFPCLVFAYYAEENCNFAVATDIIELKSKNDKVALSLKKGAYNIIIKDSKGNTQQIHIKK